MEDILDKEFECDWKEVIEEIKRMDSVYVMSSCEIQKCMNCNGYKFHCADYTSGGLKKTA